MVTELRWWGDVDCIPVAIGCSLVCLVGLRRQNGPPTGIFLFGLGVILAVLRLGSSDLGTTREALLTNALKGVTQDDWITGLFQGSLTQFPLTTLNSCLSVCALAHSLFPSRNITRRSVCLSIGLMNTILCPLGCMPHCHGAGGLAGQHRLGARTGASMLVLGLFKIFLSLVAWQGWLLTFLDALPASVLGVLLVLAGQELAITGVQTVVVDEGQESDVKERLSVCLVTGLIILGTGHTHVGALTGWIVYMVQGGGYRDLFVRRSDSIDYDQVELGTSDSDEMS